MAEGFAKDHKYDVDNSPDGIKTEIESELESFKNDLQNFKEQFLQEYADKNIKAAEGLSNDAIKKLEELEGKYNMQRMVFYHEGNQSIGRKRIAVLQKAAIECIGALQSLQSLLPILPSTLIAKQLKEGYWRAKQNDGIDGLVGPNTLSVFVDIALTMKNLAGKVFTLKGGKRYIVPSNYSFTGVIDEEFVKYVYAMCNIVKKENEGENLYLGKIEKEAVKTEVINFIDQKGSKLDLSNKSLTVNDLKNALLAIKESGKSGNGNTDTDGNTDGNTNKIKIQVLNLSGNNLTSLPAEIRDFKEIQSLDLSGNQIKNESLDMIKDLTNLTELKLSTYNNVGEIPARIGEMRNLKKLHRTDSSITSISPEIKNLTSLEELNLSNNKLTSLPEEIKNLTNLKVLNLENNDLTRLPREMRKMTNLKELNIRNNRIDFNGKKIPKCLRVFTDRGTNIISNPQKDTQKNINSSVEKEINEINGSQQQ